MKKKKILLSALALVLAVSLVAISCAAPAPVPAPAPAPTPAPAPAPAPPVPAVEVHKWANQHEMAPAGPLPDNLDVWADIVREASGGRLDITNYAGGEIVPAYDIPLALQSGLLDMGLSSTGCMAPILGDAGQLLGMTGVPGSPSYIDVTAWYYLGGGEELLDELMQDYCIHIGIYVATPEVFCHSAKPITCREDFKGLKFRTFGLWAQVLEKWGASVVTVAGAEIYEAAQRGLIDAFEYAAPSINWPQGYHEIMPCLSLPGIHSATPVGYFAVNHDSWNGLPDDLKAILRDSLRSFNIMYQMNLIKGDADAIQNYRDYGTKIFYLSDEFQQEVAQAGADLLEELAAADPLFKRIYDHQLEFIRYYRAVSKGGMPTYCIYD